MSKMSDLDAELRAAGIDPERVDLERVDIEVVRACCEHMAKTGHTVTGDEAVRELYGTAC